MNEIFKNILQVVFPLPPLASREGAQVDVGLYLIHGLMMVLFVGWGIYFLVALVKFRQSRNPVVTDKPKSANKVTLSLEIVVASLEIILLFFLSVPFWVRHVQSMPEGKDVQRLHVLGQQFAWNVHYPGPDGRFGRTDPRLMADDPLGLDPFDPAGQDDIAGINQVYVPVGKPVVIDLTSKDVIHSFSIPHMRVKKDMVPGQRLAMFFTPTKIGRYEIACSQLCGLGHYRMRGFFNVLSQADYDAWFDQNTQGPP